VAEASAFDRLNPAQRAAARFGELGADGVFRAGPLLIIAGAGTGKTNTLAHRVAHLVLEPHLQRIYEAAQVRAGDLMQLEAIGQQFATRERFLTELALDPTQASSDRAGAPLLDEDYLILSTVHSAKGQEWESIRPQRRFCLLEGYARFAL
jgi:superfamily I DNA/RNA helicase